MSETKHTPLRLPREVGGHVWLIELPAFGNSVHGQPITIGDKETAFRLVAGYNARPKVEELVGRMLQFISEKDAFIIPTNAEWKQMLGKAREVSVALGGKAE